MVDTVVVRRILPSQFLPVGLLRTSNPVAAVAVGTPASSVVDSRILHSLQRREFLLASVRDRRNFLHRCIPSAFRNVRVSRQASAVVLRDSTVVDCSSIGTARRSTDSSRNAVDSRLSILPLQRSLQYSPTQPNRSRMILEFLHQISSRTQRRLPRRARHCPFRSSLPSPVSYSDHRNNHHHRHPSSI